MTETMGAGIEGETGSPAPPPPTAGIWGRRDGLAGRRAEGTALAGSRDGGRRQLSLQACLGKDRPHGDGHSGTRREVPRRVHCCPGETEAGKE